jgi:hypothetical protein
MTNPFRKHANHLFASRGCDVDQALSYAFELVSAMPDEAKAAANTAIMVLVNTAATAFDQARGPSPERLALIELIDERIKASSSNIDQQISDWIDANLDVDNQISEWLSDNFDVNDYNVDDVVDDKIKEWASDNLADEVEKVVKNSLTFRVFVD